MREEAVRASMALPGARTLGKYRLVAELARGGMGIIYLALSRGPGTFSKLLVVKELKPELLDDPSLVSMFLEEARLAACLSHPNVVQTLEAGSEGGSPYIVMEYLDGQSLHRLIGRARRNGAAVPLELQCAVLCSALEGLAYAHAASDYDGKPLGIVHRDMSPHNVFIGYDGHVKVLDFGIAKAKISAVDTHTELLKGKIAYMAPEQAAGSNVDSRADLFPMGVMLWEAATGKRFWSEIGSDMQILRGLLRGDLDRAHEKLMLDAPDDLRPIIVKATALDPSKRYSTAALLLADLRAALAQRGAQAMTSKEIGGVLRGLFAEDRAQLQASIDEALRLQQSAAADALSVSEVRSRALATDLTHPRQAVRSSGRPGTAARAAAFAGWAVILGTLAAVGASVLPRRFAARRPAPPPAISTEPARPADVGATGTEPTENVHVIIRVSPPSARIVIDRTLVFENPCVATLRKDGAVHTAHMEADGYVSRDDSFDANSDTTLVAVLEPNRAPARPPIPRPVATPQSSPPAAVIPSTVVQEAARPSASDQLGSVPQRRINAMNPYGP